MFFSATAILTLASMATAMAVPKEAASLKSQQRGNPVVFFGDCTGTKDPNFKVSRGMVFYDMSNMDGVPPEGKGNVATKGVKPILAGQTGTSGGNLGSATQQPVELKNWNDGKEFTVYFHGKGTSDIIARWNGILQPNAESCRAEEQVGGGTLKIGDQPSQTLVCTKLGGVAAEDIPDEDLKCNRMFECWYRGENNQRGKSVKQMQKFPMNKGRNQGNRAQSSVENYGRYYY